VAKEPEKAGAKGAKAAEPEASGSGKKKLILILVAVLVLGGGGAGGYFFWKGKQDAAKKPSVAVKAPLQFYSLDPPFVANFEGNQAFRFLQITVRVATRSPETMQALKDNEPIFRNDLMLLFSQQNAEALATKEGKEKLRADALKQAKASMQYAGGKPETIETVLFTSLVMQ
jgi:flagellar FliL protein